MILFLIPAIGMNGGMMCRSSRNSVKNCPSNTFQSPSKNARLSLSGNICKAFTYSGCVSRRILLSQTLAGMNSNSFGSSSSLNFLSTQILLTQACHFHHGLVEAKKFGLIPFLVVLKDQNNIFTSISVQCVNSSIPMKSYSIP